MANRFRDILTRHAGKVYGSVLGLIVGWIIIRYGVLRGGLFVIYAWQRGGFIWALVLIRRMIPLRSPAAFEVVVVE